MHIDPVRNRLDRSTRNRLAGLALPVDTSGLERRLEEAIEDTEQATPSAARLVLQRWWRPVTSAAAAIILSLLGWMAMESQSTVMAGPAQLAQLHYDVTRGLTPALPATSIEEANRQLAQQSMNAQQVGQLPGEVLSCCLHEISGATLSCVLLKQNGHLITVVVADGASVHAPEGEVVTRSGRQIVLHRANGINMAVTSDGRRWACIMGQVPYEQLVETAAQLELSPHPVQFPSFSN